MTDTKNNGEVDKTEIAVIDEQSIRDKIYVVRGVQVMLDFELAEIYGYTTKAFNQQVKNNSAKFDDDFRFQLTSEEVEELSGSKNLTTMQTKGMKGGRTYILTMVFYRVWYLYAYDGTEGILGHTTEQGVD